MANYKVVDADKLDADLTSVADTIREKSGISGKIAFPDAYKTGISGAYSNGFISGQQSGWQSGYNTGYTAGSGNLAKFLAGTGKTFHDESVTSVRGYGFYFSLYTSISLPNLTSIQHRAFSQCVSLKSVSLASFTGELAQYMCAQCSMLDTFHAPLAEYTSGYVFQDCTSLRVIDLPRLRSINAGVFQRCSALQAVVLRRTDVCSLVLTTAFQGTPIESGGTMMGYVYVPSELLTQYASATNWTTYASRLRPIESFTVDGTITGELDLAKMGVT